MRLFTFGLLVVVLGGCSLFRVTPTPCARDENCFAGQVCGGFVCVDAPAPCPITLELGCNEACQLATPDRTEIFTDDFSVGPRGEYCSEYIRDGDTLTDVVELDLGFTPGFERVELRAIVEWSDTEGDLIAARFNANFSDAGGTVFTLSRIDGRTELRLERATNAPGVDRVLSRGLEPGVYFLELVNRTDATTLTLTRGAFVGERGAEIIELLRVEPTEDEHAQGTRFFIGTGANDGRTRVDRFSLSRGPEVDSLDSVRLVDTFEQAALEPGWQVNGDGPLLDGGAVSCPQRCELARAIGPSSRVRLQLELDPTAVLTFNSGGVNVRISGGGVLEGAGDGSLPDILGAHIFMELAQAAEGGHLTFRDSGFNGRLRGRVTLDQSGPLATPLTLILEAGARLHAIYLEDVSVDEGASIVLANFDEAETEQATLVPGLPWQGDLAGIGAGVYGGPTLSIDPETPAGDLRLRYTLLPDEAGVTEVSTNLLDDATEIAALTTGDRGLLQLAAGAEEKFGSPLFLLAPLSEPLFVERGITADGPGYITARRGSFTGEVVGALEIIPAAFDKGLLQLSATRGAVTDVELALVDVAAPRGLLFFDSFDGTTVQRPEVFVGEYPHRDLIEGLEKSFGGLVALDAGATGRYTLDAAGPLGTDVRARMLLNIRSLDANSLVFALNGQAGPSLLLTFTDAAAELFARGPAEAPSSEALAITLVEGAVDDGRGDLFVEATLSQAADQATLSVTASPVDYGLGPAAEITFSASDVIATDTFHLTFDQIVEQAVVFEELVLERTR